MTYHGEWVDCNDELHDEEYVAIGDDTMHRITHVGSVPLLEQDGYIISLERYCAYYYKESCIRWSND